MSTTAAQGQDGPIAGAATTVAASWTGHAAKKVIGRIASVIARRAEARLPRDLARLDDRLLGDIGIYHGMKVVLMLGRR